MFGGQGCHSLVTLPRLRRLKHIDSPMVVLPALPPLSPGAAPGLYMEKLLSLDKNLLEIIKMAWERKRYVSVLRGGSKCNCVSGARAG